MIRHLRALEGASLRRRRQFRAASLFLLACALGAWSNLSLGQAPRGGGLQIERPWSRPTAPGVSVGVGYMVITNGGKADALVAASTPAAERVEIHFSRMDGGVMRMRRMERVELPAGQAVKFEPGGLHLMLIGLRQPLEAGRKLPLTLRFAGAGEQTVELKVESQDAAPAGADPSHH